MFAQTTDLCGNDDEVFPEVILLVARVLPDGSAGVYQLLVSSRLQAPFRCSYQLISTGSICLHSRVKAAVPST